MSELKTYNSERIYWAVEQVEREAGDIDDLHLDDSLFYLKSEVDKVIAGLEAENVQLKKQSSCAFSDDCLRVRQLKREVRKWKYKRCLTMAEWCDVEADAADADGDYEDMRWYQKWHHRWLELAKKLKEADK